MGEPFETLPDRPFSIKMQSPSPVFPLRLRQRFKEEILALRRRVQPADAGQPQFAVAVRRRPGSETSNGRLTGFRTTSALASSPPICFSASRRLASETKQQHRAAASAMRYRAAMRSVCQSSSPLDCPIVTNGNGAGNSLERFDRRKGATVRENDQRREQAAISRSTA